MPQNVQNHTCLAILFYRDWNVFFLKNDFLLKMKKDKTPTAYWKAVCLFTFPLTKSPSNDKGFGKSYLMKLVKLKNCLILNHFVTWNLLRVKLLERVYGRGLVILVCTISKISYYLLNCWTRTKPFHLILAKSYLFNFQLLCCLHFRIMFILQQFSSL